MKDNEAINQGLNVFKPHIPRKPRAFNKLNLRWGTVCTLKLAGYSKKEIQGIVNMSNYMVNKCLAIGRGEYPQFKQDLQ